MMDSPTLEQGLHRQALTGLGRLNQLSRSSDLVWSALCGFARNRHPAPLRVLDIACGGGDVTLALAQTAAARGVSLEIAGCDISSYAVEHSRKAAKLAGCGQVEFFVLDALRDPLPQNYDVLTCSLFIHHLDEAEIALLFRKMMAAARQSVVINDLERSRAGYFLAWGACHLLTRSPVVHVDGPLSVRAAFTRDELRELALRAGMNEVQITRHWPFRQRLLWIRP